MSLPIGWLRVSDHYYQNTFLTSDLLPLNYTLIVQLEGVWSGTVSLHFSTLSGASGVPNSQRKTR